MKLNCTVQNYTIQVVVFAALLGCFYAVYMERQTQIYNHLLVNVGQEVAVTNRRI